MYVSRCGGTATRRVRGISFLRVAASVSAILLLQGCDARGRSPDVITSNDTIIISGEPACAQCRIALSDSVSIGVGGDPVTLSLTMWATRRGDGELFVTGAYGAYGVVEYDATGQFVRVIGKKGSGPTEFGGQPTRPTLLRGDTLVAYDLRLKRFMRIAPDGSLLGPFAPSFRPWDVTATPDGTLLVTGAVPATDPFEQGRPAHFLAMDGSVIRSVGDSLVFFCAGGGAGADADRSAALKQVAMSRDGTIALANYSGYDITLHFADGTRRVISRKADWFFSIGDRHPKVSELWFDDSDRLWVTLYVPQEAGGDTTPNDNGDDLQTLTQSADNVVEVFDVHAGELLASHRYPVPFFISNGLAIGPVERPSGLTGYTIWHPSLLTR
jgi:hypothetical protein